MDFWILVHLVFSCMNINNHVTPGFTQNASQYQDCVFIETNKSSESAGSAEQEVNLNLWLEKQNINLFTK